MLPKVEFKLARVEKEAEMLIYFCKGRKGWDWSEKIYMYHPALREILEDKSPEEAYAGALVYAQKYIDQHEKDMQELVGKYQKEWNEINDAYLSILSNHLETGYPTDRKVITAYVSIVPIFPRFLDEWAYNVSSRNPQSVVPISMHEILHFVYFKKWLEVFPETKKEEMGSPHLVWKLSEILDSIILNGNPEIQELHPCEHGHYKEFENVIIGGEPLTAHFENLYKRHLQTNEAFADFLKTCWADTLANREVLEKI